MTFFKKIILLIIIILEFIIGGFFLYKYYGLSKVDPTVVELNSDNIEINIDSELKYYYELKPNITEVDQPEWLEEKAIYTYNNDGLNERYNYEIEKKEGVFRIITLGDSFTFGHFISTSFNWTELLEDELNNSTDLCPDKTFEVINLGIGGYDVSYIAERYERKGKKYNPDLVVWLESGEGYYRYIELMQPILNDCKESSLYSEEEKNAHGFCWNKATDTIKKQYKITDLSNKINSYLDSFFKVIDNNKVIFFGFSRDFSIKDRNEAINIRLNDYPFMDFRLVIPSIFENGEILLDTHPNRDGHETIKNSIFESIKEDIRKTCP